jgi:hypothetical protein
MLLLRRLPLQQRPETTASVRSNKTAIRAARKRKIGEEVESEPFSRWRAKQLEKMKNQVAFPTQVVWYVGIVLVPKISPPMSDIHLTISLA